MASSIPKVGDIDDEDNILTTKIKLTKNEYNATIRNKLEYNRLKVIKRHLSSQSDLNACKIRTSVHETKKWLDENQKVVCNIHEFFHNRQVHSAVGQYPSRLPGVHSSLSRLNQARRRAKSVSTISRPYTAPLQTLADQYTDLDSDEEASIVPISRLTSGKFSVDRAPSAVSQPLFEPYVPSEEPPPVAAASISHRITWPVKLQVFALQDEEEARKQFLAWRAEQRKTKARRSSKPFFDSELERQYQVSIRRRQDIEAFATPELIEEHRFDDPVFAKRYRQLRLAVRANKLPLYDPADCEINIAMSKSKIERARSALITAKESQIKNYYRSQQTRHDTNLAQRVQAFLDRVAQFKKENQQEV